METFFDIAQDMLCIADHSGRFTRTNGSWTRHLGWTEDELCSRPYREFVHPEDRDRTDIERGRLEDGQETLSFRNRYRHKDGGYHWIDWRALVHEETGLIYASARDVTQDILLHEELVSREELLTAMVAQQLRTREQEQQRIANDLHDTTLQHSIAAKMFLELVPSEAPELGKAHAELQLAMQSTRKIMQGLDPLDLREQTVDAALRSLADDLQERYGIEVEVELGPVGEHVDDEVAAGLFRMVHEAMVNAAKHSEAGSIRVVVGTDEDFVVAEVLDDGRGITAAGAQGGGEGSGAGLGMAFMQERAASLDGTVDVTSGPSGTRVRVRLPRARASEIEARIAM